MEKANQDIRNHARESGVYLWEVAAQMGISEPTITRMMRRDVSVEKREQLLHVIDEIAAQKENAC